MHLAFLRPLCEQPGPWASVYLDASRDSEDAATAVHLRLRAAREELASLGAEEQVLA